MDAARLAALVAWGSAAWPTVRAPDFERFVGAHDAGRELLSAADESACREGASELWLACAVIAGDAEATRRFDERYVSPLARTLARMKLSATELDEVQQRVREKLLVGGRLAEYAGRGKLEGLVQVVATREAISLLRKGKREIPTDDDLASPLLGPVDPGLEMLKGRTAEAFRAAFASAIATLEPRQRNLLRQHLAAGVTLEQLAAMHDVHRETVVRWLRDAREHVLAETKKALAASMEIREGEVESLLGLARSRLDVSLGALDH